MRNQAYLAAHQGREAAAEFQKIIDHRGIVLNGPIRALARLQIARAYVMQNDTAKARAAYQHFLTLWKDAGPDISILRQAKAEYKKLTATASTSASVSGRETKEEEWLPEIYDFRTPRFAVPRSSPQ